jgi:hypothetical protein
MSASLDLLLLSVVSLVSEAEMGRVDWGGFDSFRGGVAGAGKGSSDVDASTGCA